MYCPNCDFKNENEKFCGNCGFQIMNDLVDNQIDDITKSNGINNLSINNDKINNSTTLTDNVHNIDYASNTYSTTKENMYTKSSKGNNKNNKFANNLIIKLIGIAIIFLLIAGCYFIFFKKNGKINDSEILEDQLMTDMILDENGIPKFIDGNFTDRLVTDGKSALLVIDDIKDIMKIKDVSKEFILKSIHGNANKKFYKFSQTYQGLTVFGNELVISVDDNNHVSTLSGNYIPNIQIEINNVINEKQLEEKLIKKYGENVVIKSSEKQIYNENEKNYVVYVCNIVTENKFLKVIVNAETGDILNQYGLIYEVAYEYTGIGLDGKDYTITLDKDEWGGYNFHDPNRNISIIDGIDFGLNVGTDNAVQYFNIIYLAIMGQLKKDPIKANMLGDVLVYKGVNRIKNAYTALSTFSKTYDYYKNILGRDSFDDNGAEIIVYIDVQKDALIPITDEVYNAAWIGDFIGGFFLGTTDNLTFATAVDVVAHEFTHAIIEYTAQLEYNGESGALNEAYADIMGSLIEGKNFTIAEDLGKIGRDMANPNKYKDPAIKDGKYYFPTDTSTYSEEWVKSKGYTLDNYKDEYDNGGVHTNSNVPNHAAYLMYNNGAFESREQMAKVWYQSLFYLTESSNFEDCALAVLKSAQDLGLSQESLLIIEQAFIDTKMLEQKYFLFSGTVIDDKNGETLNGVKVQAINTKNENLVYTTYTSKEGEYIFNKLPVGSYEVSYSKIGYDTLVNKILLNKDSVENVSLKLDKIDTTYCNPKKEVCVKVIMYELGTGSSGNLTEVANEFYYKKGDNLNKALKGFNALDSNGNYGTSGLPVSAGWYYRGTNKVVDWDEPVNDDVEIEMRIAGLNGQDIIDFSNMFGY